MPRKPLKICAHPGCGAKTRNRCCEKHTDQRQQAKQQNDKLRPNSYQRGYNRAWAKARKIYLAENPLCVDHLKKGEHVLATVVDHIKPHRGDKVLFWDRSNWQALCKPCHDRKTATEDSGFAGWNSKAKPASLSPPEPE